MIKWEMDAIKVALDEMYKQTLSLENRGEVANYIPFLGEVDPKLFCACISADLGNNCIGDMDAKFSIQSVSKVMSLAMALEMYGANMVFEHTGMENSQHAFNDIKSIDQIPSNPFVNAGAITITGLLYDRYGENTAKEVIRFMSNLSGRNDIYIDEEVFNSEMETCSMNRTLVYYLKHLGLIKGNPEKVLEEYIKSCSITTGCETVACIAKILSKGGGGLKKSTATSVVTQMAICGMYSKSGEFLMKVGMPAKSGVSGVIMAVVPGGLGVAVYSPRLDEFGNSYRGSKFLELLSEKLELNIFKRG